MGRKLGAGGVALAVLAAAGTAALASPKCATPADVTAIQVAAVQQELMVAALTCDDTTSFNAFQTGYSRELRRSDRHLQAMFGRLYGWKGHAEYHAFKTRLANNSSIRSIHDNRAFCKETNEVFAAALVADKPSLADFVSGVTVHDDGPVESCQLTVENGFKRAIPNVVPKPNPLRLAAFKSAPAPEAAAAPKAADGAAPQTAGADSATTPAAAAASPQASGQSQQAAAAPADQDKTGDKDKDADKKTAEKKKSGWLSGLTGLFD